MRRRHVAAPPPASEATEIDQHGWDRHERHSYDGQPHYHDGAGNTVFLPDPRGRPVASIAAVGIPPATVEEVRRREAANDREREAEERRTMVAAEQVGERFAPANRNGRLGADLGGMEVVKASYRTLFPHADSNVAEQYALTMGIGDLVGRILSAHQQGRCAERGLTADLLTLATQLDVVTAACEAAP
jgi:hypothetical protein